MFNMDEVDGASRQVGFRLHKDQFAVLLSRAKRADMTHSAYAKSVLADHLSDDLSGDLARDLMLEQHDKLDSLRALLTAVLCAALMPSVSGNGREERLSSLLALVDRSLRSSFLIRDSVDGWKPESEQQEGGA